MCIRVQFAALDSIRPWDASRRVISIPNGLDEAYAIQAVRETLRQLDVDQDAFGARCWCGEPIRLLPRIPQQRRSDEVMAHGS